MTPPRPILDRNFQSNIPGLYVIGDLAGAPVIKLAMEQGYTVARHIAGLADAGGGAPGGYDVIVAGAGAAGLNAALTLSASGLRVLVIEKGRIANTIADFPEGKWIYAEPEGVAAKGSLWLEGSSKEELLERWAEAVRTADVEVRAQEGLTGIKRLPDGHFQVVTERGEYRGRRVIVATGQRGNPRRLGVAGEDAPNVYHRLYNPREYKGAEIVVVGGGNSAAEAALALAATSRVTLIYRRRSFHRVFRANRRRLEASGVRVLLGAEVREFRGRAVTVAQDGRAVELPFDHAFVLIGAEAPAAFLRSLGLRLEGEWTGSWVASAALMLAALVALAQVPGHGWWAGFAAIAAVGGLVFAGVRGSRFAWLGVSFLVAYSIYGAKLGTGAEFWPYRGWGYRFFSVLGRPMSFWYTVAYTAVVTVFGIQAMRRWGIERGDRFQTWRYVSLIGFQWTFFFLIPEFLFQWAVRYQWVGATLAQDPNFANNAWRSYGIVYAWPLFFYTFFGSPDRIWVVWGVLLSFVLLPLLTLFHGKRYCSWICGCGGLAETLGDRWRHLAPKGHAAVRWERMNGVVLAAASAITLAMVGSDVMRFVREPANRALEWYRLLVDVWLVGIIPVTLYPFYGGKIWCRYWCPLAKMMQLFSGWFTRWKASRFAIYANEKCIACGECTRYCQVGIDVMRFAMRQETIDNVNSSCIGCGICVTACPMGVLSFRRPEPVQLVQIETGQAGAFQ